MVNAVQEGMSKLASACRVIVPPALDFVVIVYAPDGEMKISSAMTGRHGYTNDQLFARARKAAEAFLTHQPTSFI